MGEEVVQKSVEFGGLLDTMEGRVVYADARKGHIGPHNITVEGHLVDCLPGCPLYQSEGRGRVKVS